MSRQNLDPDFSDSSLPPVTQDFSFGRRLNMFGSYLPGLGTPIILYRRVDVFRGMGREYDVATPDVYTPAYSTGGRPMDGLAGYWTGWSPAPP